MITEKDIEGNLFDLNRDLAASGLVVSENTGVFDFVTHPGYAWPDMIYPGPRMAASPADPDMQMLTGLRSVPSCPRLLIMGQRHITGTVTQQLDQLRFRPATRWVNMAIPLPPAESDTDKRQPDPAAGDTGNGLLECRPIDAAVPDEWQDWASVVEPVLFKGKRLDSRLFQYAQEKGLFKLVAGYHEHRPVTSSLLYCGRQAGIYMVSTLPAFQGRGFAGTLIRFVYSAAKASGYDSVVLHSTQAGLEFYRRLGFREYGSLNLYYSLL